jgi:hypothetical protein
MNPENTPPPSTFRIQTAHPGRRSLPPSNAPGPQHVMPTYPSSTLQYYYPPYQHSANYTHISPLHQPYDQLHDTVTPNPMLLPSVSQSHLPSLRHTPTDPIAKDTDNQHIQNSPFTDQHYHNFSRTSQRIHSLSPIAFAEHQSVPTFAAPQPIPLQQNHTFPFVNVPHPVIPPPNYPIQFTPYANSHSSSIPSLPSTKDVPILTGKHDWGPWHSAVRTLIINANLLGHIADEPLPGAIFDPGLWPTYPPPIQRGSNEHQIQAFTDWWSRDGLASHVLTSRLSPSVLGCLPIPNDRLGQRRSARSVYLTLRHQFGAGDYSAVMVIEAKLRQLRCLPTRGGVRITDFITTWRVSINQMEAAGFLPGARQLLSILADGLPLSTVAFINLHDNIMNSLNEPNEQLLPNIHHLFDQLTNIENNMQRTRLLNPITRRPPPPSNTHTITPTTQPPPAPANAPSPTAQTATRLICSNCGRPGHSEPTCFQPGGAMEGRRDEYLAS